MAARLKEMFEGWEKWKIAVVVGAPIALGVVGLWYYRRNVFKDVTAKPTTTPVTEAAAPQQPEDLLAKAQEAKAKGNKCFKAGKYDEAIASYTEAISICPQNYKVDLSTFYQNRAAAHDHLKDYRAVTTDCSSAITLNGRYTKAFLRRAKAHEQLGELMESLLDLTAVCILEQFKNPTNLQMADRILKELGKTQAKEAVGKRVPTNPSKHFIRNYYNGFANDPILKWAPSETSELLNDNLTNEITQEPVQETEQLEELHITEDQPITYKESSVDAEIDKDVDDKEKDTNKDEQDTNKDTENEPETNKVTLQEFDNEQTAEQTGEQTDKQTETESRKDDMIEQERSRDFELRPFHKARENLLREEYDDIITLCTQEIDNTGSRDLAAPALLLRGTFYLLRGQQDLAKTDFCQLIDDDAVDKKIRVNALIKRAGILMQEDKQTECLGDFASAVRIDPENCDVFHHRGQQNLALERLKDAQVDFDRSIQLNPEHAISHVQRCYGDYKEAVMRQNPIQLQMSVKKFADVVQKFPTCPDAHTLYAQALADDMRFDEADQQFEEALKIDPENASTIVHRALLTLQWKQDLDKACEMINQAIDVDPTCEFAYETLGTLKVQKGDLNGALELFDKAVNLCQLESDLSHIFALKNAAIAQVKVATHLGVDLPTFA